MDAPRTRVDQAHSGQSFSQCLGQVHALAGDQLFDGTHEIVIADHSRCLIVDMSGVPGHFEHDIKADVLGSIAVEGVFDFDKDPTISISAGAKVYWDATNEYVVTTATGNKLIGKAIAAAGVNETIVRARLNQ